MLLTQPGFKHFLWCSWQPWQISPQLSLQKSLETSTAGMERAPQGASTTTASPSICISPTQHGHAICSRVQRWRRCRPQCKYLLWQPVSPPLAPFSLQTATHHNNQSQFSCYCYYKFRSQSTLHAPDTESKPQLYLSIWLHAENQRCMWKSRWGSRLQPGQLRQCLTVSNSGYYSSLTPIVTAPGS